MNKTNNRIETVHRLIKINAPLPKTITELKDFPWDYDGTPATLYLEDLMSACSQLLTSTITDAELEEWANAIESREDICFEKNHSSEIKNFIYSLANPYLVNKTMHEIAKTMLIKITLKIQNNSKVKSNHP